MIPKLAVFVIGGQHLASLAQAYETLTRAHPGFMQLEIRSLDDLGSPGEIEAFGHEIRTADLTMFFFHGGRAAYPIVDQLLETASGTRIFIHPDDDDDLELSRKLSTDFGSEFFDQAVRYLKYGGPINGRNLLKRVALELGGPDLAPDPPRPQVCQSLYHPRLGLVQTLEEYLSGLGRDLSVLDDPGVPIIGLWFIQHYFLESNLEPFDAIIQEIEHQGGLPIACFYRRFPDPFLDRRDTPWVIRNFFQKDGKTVIHALINAITFSLRLTRPEESEALSELDVPILQTMNLNSSRTSWEGSIQGLSPSDVGNSVAQPEFDGLLITVPSATREIRDRDSLTGATIARQIPIPERIAKLVGLANKWARLGRIPNDQKKVAVIFHNYPPRNDRIGCAAGLDSFASVAGLLKRLDHEGFKLDRVFDDPQDLADLMVRSLTADRKWLTPEAMADRAADRVGPEITGPWNEALPSKNREEMARDWGSPPGELYVHQNQVLINGVINGNVYIGIQPPRGFLEQPEKIHDPYLAPTHHYLAYYRWIRNVFQADAVLHIGKHGSLEWLPGKSVGLGPECYPDLAIMDLPNIYPFIINDPGEGTQAKRRAFCCIDDHLIPVMTNADRYDELAELDRRILQYLDVKAMNPSRLSVVEEEIWTKVEEASLNKDLGMTKEEAFEDFDDFMEKLHAYLTEIGDTAVQDGLHTLGLPPQGDGLVELATQMVRIKNGPVPSLREAVAEHWGYDYDHLLAHKGRTDPTGRFQTNGTALEGIHQACLEITRAAQNGSRAALAEESPKIRETADFLNETVLPVLARTTEEIDAIINALSGRYVPPGPSGSPTRGMVDILPTGRNFFSVDPFRIPTTTAWEVGVQLGDNLIQRYLADNGQPPDTIGLVLWGSPTMRNQGEDVAEAMYLMGIRPVWNPKNGKIRGLSPIPLADLKFPRVDVTFRTSGFFRDSFPNLSILLDQAVRMAAALKEPPDKNFLRRNVMREVETLAKQGLTPEDAFREASFRVYSDPPGVYGAGVDKAIDSGTWQSSEDLGNVYITWSGFAYGEGVYGADKRDNFRRRLADIKLVVKNEDSREYDLMSSDDFNAYFGGFFCAVKTASQNIPQAYSGDASDPDRVKNRSIQEESRHVFRSRILNPKWIEGLMRHGFKGAGDLSRTVDTSFHWDATSDVVEEWMYEGLAQKYALSPRMREWFKKVNPHALRNISERLLEAIGRGMWDASPEMKAELEAVLLDIEGDIEDMTQ